MTYKITDSSSHTLKWRYVKDYSVSDGDDCGWVDKVQWSGSSGPSQPPSGGLLSEALDTALSFTTTGDAAWFDTYLDRLLAVTASEAQDVAQRYLKPSRRNFGWFTPVNGREG